MEYSLKPNKHDIIVGYFMLVLIISIIISLVSFKNSDDHYVYIKYDGDIVHKMDLHNDEIFMLNKGDEKYPDLQGDFEVTVKDKKAFISKNTCPQSFCKHLGSIDSKGQSLICAPNKIVVEIGDNKQLDCDWGVCIDE